MWELTKSFRFEAAHSLPGTTLGEASDEVHGHRFALKSPSAGRLIL
jgi:6-pyruvoyltetrahydropterin/6-carboxytetrahydropterin synthase